MRVRGKPLSATASALALFAVASWQVRAESDGNPFGLRGGQHPTKALAGETPAYATGPADARPLEARAFEAQRVQLKASLLATAGNVAATETRIADAQARLDALGAREVALKHSLEGRRAVVAEVLAALQRMGRKPPPALLVDPDDVLKAMRTSMLLGAVLPGMRAEARTLLRDLAELSRTKRAVEDEKRGLDADLATMNTERRRLATLVDARQNAQPGTGAEREAERDKAKQVGEQAASFKDLLGRMEHDSAPAAKGAEAAREADRLAALVPDGVPNPNAAAPFKDPARLAPAVAFSATRGLLPLPVSGTPLRRFGEDDGLGGTQKGALYGTLPSAVVEAPADSWIAYAGPYRSYGQLVILNAGGGYYIVLAGMERINVDLGQFVLAGEPIAVMGDGSKKTAAAIALGAAQPVLYVEFRKDGATLDPGPWWAKPELQKVRG